MKKGQKKGEHIDLIGSVFGRLKILSLHGRDNERFRYEWLCKCECGAEKIVFQDLLISGKTRSCGCLLRESRYAKNDNTDRTVSRFKILYSAVKKRHKTFSSGKVITLDEFMNFSFKDCYYCGSKPSSKQEDIRYENRKGEGLKLRVTDNIFYINGIDRIDSKGGYETENIVACCRYCNTAKNTLTQSEFKNHINRIYEHFAKK